MMSSFTKLSKVFKNARSKTKQFCIAFYILATYNTFADCTVTSSISASNFLATYGSCTGTLIIPAGVVLTINTSLTMPAGINKIVIQNGGQIAWTNGSNLQLRLAPNTSIDIENTSTTSGVKALGGACNNNDEIYIGTVQYGVCVGGGACIDFATLITNGGTIQIDPTVVVTGGTSTNNIVCSTIFGLNAAINGFVYGTPTFKWTQTSGPSNTTFTPGDNVQSPTLAVTNLGVYTYKVEVTVPLSQTCLTTFLTVNSSITVNVQNCVQPVDLLKFEGTNIDKGSLLKWSTASEQDFSHFVIQKSNEGTYFENIVQVAGQVSSLEKKDYSYLDANSTSAYYRLQMVDLDGTSSMSKVIYIQANSGGASVGQFYPNPSQSDFVQIEIYSPKQSTWTITGLDILGRNMYTETRSLDEGKNTIKLNIPKKSNKSLLYKFEHAEGTFLRKLQF